MKRLIFIIILLPAFIIGASADLDAAARDAGIYGVEDSLTDDARDITGKLLVGRWKLLSSPALVKSSATSGTRQYR